MGFVRIQPLEPLEWHVFKQFRLAALRAAPGMFATSYDEAAARSDDAWRDIVAGPGHQVFGLFDDARLIGITAAFPWNEDATGETATLVMSFIVPEYRGQGLSKMLYEARLDWIRAQPHFKRVVVSHRASNEASRRITQRYGFVPIGRAPRVWPDGIMEDEVSYELRISK